MFRASLVPLAVAAVLLLPAWAVSDDDDDSRRSRVKRVEVINFPNPQQVVGTVEVTNLPPVQDVNVVNPPECSAPTPARYQLVGFSTESFVGNRGLLALSRACGADFPGSRICQRPEIVDTSPLPEGLSGVAWIDTPEDPTGSATCADWRVALLFRVGNAVVLDSITTAENQGLFPYRGFLREFCSVATPVACCALVP